GCCWPGHSSSVMRTRGDHGKRQPGRTAARSAAIVMMVVGALMLGHVGYDLWGTGWATARAPRDLRDQFRAELRHQGAGQGFVQAAVGVRSDLARRRSAVPIVPHGVLGLIQIPSIKLDMAFVQGVDPGALALGPGHYPQTPLPGARGNVAIAGHRTTHG